MSGAAEVLLTVVGFVAAAGLVVFVVSGLLSERERFDNALRQQQAVRAAVATRCGEVLVFNPLLSDEAVARVVCDELRARGCTDPHAYTVALPAVSWLRGTLVNNEVWGSFVERRALELLVEFEGGLTDEQAAVLIHDELVNARVCDPAPYTWATPATVGRLRRTLVLAVARDRRAARRVGSS